MPLPVKRFLVFGVVAICMSSFAFWLGVTAHGPDFLGWHASGFLWHLLDAPTSTLNALLPDTLCSRFAVQFRQGPYCFPDSSGKEFWRYLRVGTVAWMAALYFVVAVDTIRNRWARRSVEM